jgi:ABC-2 type transport system permease protein
MKKTLTIAWKDLLMTFRDPGALIMLLATPFALTLAIGFAFGGFNRGSSAGLADIPVTLVNHDPGQFGLELVNMFSSPDLAELMELVTLQDEAVARLGVDQDLYAAAVIIPADFSESILPASLLEGQVEDLASDQQIERIKSVVEVYTNPTRPVSAGVVRSVVDRFINQVTVGATGGEVAITQLILSGLITPQQAGQVGAELGRQLSEAAVVTELIQIKDETSSPTGGFDWLAYTAPSMAIMFLMFTVTSGGRSILTERQKGTLSRLLVTPSRAVEVLGGKVLGIYLVGLAQMSILVGAGWLLFQIHWGDIAGVILLLIALVAAASGWGMLLAAYARKPGQVGAVGTALALVFAAASGNFVPRQAMPQWLRTISLVLPNAWGLEGFQTLASGGTLTEITGILLALTAMAVVLFSISALAFRKQYA